VEAEMGKMALLYDMCALKTVDLEYEIKEKKRLQLDTKEEEDALNLGRFMVVPYDSRDVYFEWTNLGLRSVCVVQHRHASEVVQEWGKKAQEHPALVALALETNDTDWVTYYDYTDLHTRSVWVEEGRTYAGVPGQTPASGRWHLDHGKNPLPFINWAIRGGTELETDGTHKYQPLLYPVYATGAWDIKNIVQTLGVSEVIAHTGSPKYVETGPNSQQADIDFFSPERIAKMAQGNTLSTLQPIAVDQALAGVEAMLSAQLDKQMVSQVLQGGALPAGIAFATLNLVTQTAIGVLKPAKYLVETVLAEMYTQMLKWAEFTGKDIEGYVVGGDDDGTQLLIDADTLDGRSIYIDVELHPDAPSDRAQKVNTASIMVDRLGMSQASAMDEVGVEDPEEEIKKGIFERMVQHEIELELQAEVLDLQNRKQLELKAESMKIDMLAQQKQMEMQQRAEAAAQQQQQGGPEGPPPEEGPPQNIPAQVEQPPPGVGGAGAGLQGMPNAAPFALGAPEENAEGAGGPESQAEGAV
jgi:hypothetical protein